VRPCLLRGCTGCSKALHALQEAALGAGNPRVHRLVLVLALVHLASERSQLQVQLTQAARLLRAGSC